MTSKDRPAEGRRPAVEAVPGNEVPSRRQMLAGVLGAGTAAWPTAAGAEFWDRIFGMSPSQPARPRSRPVARRPVPTVTLASPDFAALAEPGFLAGLRPHRDGGMRLAIDRGDDVAAELKLLVHNYGHGGGGMTLGFGAAEEVRRLVEQATADEDVEEIAVLGSGVIGLTTARALNERWPAAALTVYAAECEVARTTSHLAGGQFAPASTLTEYTTSAERAFLDRQLALSETVLRRLVKSGDADDLGISRRASYSLAGGGDIRIRLGQSTRLAHRYDSWLIDPTRLLPGIKSRLEQRGVRFEKRRLASRAEVLSVPQQIVVNCTGLGAAELFQDRAVSGRRGHLVRLINPQPDRLNYFLNSWCGDDRLRYLFARGNDIVIGGTSIDASARGPFDPSDASDVRTCQRILASARALFEGGATCA